MVTERQRELIIAIGADNENRKDAHDNLGISRDSMRHMLSRFFTGFMADFELIEEYFNVFERNFKNAPAPETNRRIRRFSRKLQKLHGI